MPRDVANERQEDALGAAGPTPRAAEIQTLLQSLAALRDGASSSRFAALAAAIADCTLAGDETALIVAQQGLQRLYSEQLGTPRPTADQHEQRGRTLQALASVTWTLQRLTPQAVLSQLEVGGLGLRFLEAVAAHPGLYSGQIGELLDGARDDTVSHLGRRLESAGFVRKQRVGRRKHWYITPRGQRVLDDLVAESQ